MTVPTDLLDELERLREAATPGEWGTYWGTRIASGVKHLGPGVSVDRYVGEVADEDDRADYDNEPNPASPSAAAALIVAEHNAVPRLVAAVRAALELHTPVEWQECDEDGVPDLDKPLTPFCRECTDDEYVSAVEFGDTIDRGSPVIDWPCATVEAVTTALAGRP